MPKLKPQIGEKLKNNGGFVNGTETVYRGISRYLAMSDGSNRCAPGYGELYVLTENGDRWEWVASGKITLDEYQMWFKRSRALFEY
jgi:hypothetical protein